tara:strand:- start:743 stop:1552 length:810 start_codon:yes stop_codon:yes gene_type:complete
VQEGSDGGEGNVGGVGVDDGGGSGGGGDGDGGAGGVKAGDMGGVPSIDPSELTRVLSSAVLGGRVCLGRKRAAVLATAWPTCGALAAASAAELTAQCPPGFPLTLLQHVVGALRPLVRGYTGAEPMVVDNPAGGGDGEGGDGTTGGEGGAGTTSGNDGDGVAARLCPSCGHAPSADGWCTYCCERVWRAPRHAVPAAAPAHASGGTAAPPHTADDGGSSNEDCSDDDSDVDSDDEDSDEEHPGTDEDCDSGGEADEDVPAAGAKRRTRT